MEEKVFPATLDSLEPIRDYVTQVAAEAGLDRGATYDLTLAVDEIATNVVLHGYEEAGLSGDMRIGSGVEGKKLVVWLKDFGQPYDPNFHDIPDELDLQLPLEDRPIGGLGILLAKNGVEDLQYTHGDDGNVHRFVMPLPQVSTEQRDG